jgi:hypothetical protein
MQREWLSLEQAETWNLIKEAWKLLKNGGCIQRS